MKIIPNREGVSEFNYKYSLSVFNAERHKNGSNYRRTAIEFLKLLNQIYSIFFAFVVRPVCSRVKPVTLPLSSLTKVILTSAMRMKKTVSDSGTMPVPRVASE